MSCRSWIQVFLAVYNVNLHPVPLPRLYVSASEYALPAQLFKVFNFSLAIGRPECSLAWTFFTKLQLTVGTPLHTTQLHSAEP
jgi:hypothetical protein